MHGPRDIRSQEKMMILDSDPLLKYIYLLSGQHGWTVAATEAVNGDA